MYAEATCEVEEEAGLIVDAEIVEEVEEVVEVEVEAKVVVDEAIKATNSPEVSLIDADDNRNSIVEEGAIKIRTRTNIRTNIRTRTSISSGRTGRRLPHLLTGKVEDDRNRNTPHHAATRRERANMLRHQPVALLLQHLPMRVLTSKTIQTAVMQIAVMPGLPPIRTRTFHNLRIHTHQRIHMLQPHHTQPRTRMHPRPPTRLLNRTHLQIRTHLRLRQRFPLVHTSIQRSMDSLLHHQSNKINNNNRTWRNGHSGFKLQLRCKIRVNLQHNPPQLPQPTHDW